MNARDVEQLWKDTFTYLFRWDGPLLLTSLKLISNREEESLIFPITIHPDVSGLEMVIQKREHMELMHAML